MKLTQILNKFKDLDINNDRSWSEVTTLGIGQGMPYVFKPKDDKELVEVLKETYLKNIEVIPIGKGSNILGSDENVDILYIDLSAKFFSEIQVGRTSHITVGGSISLMKLAKLAANHNLGGIANLTPIPSSVGAAIKINAGARIEIKDFVSEIFGYYKNGEIWSADSKNISWEYRKTSIPNDIIITGAIFKFNKVDKEEELKLISEEIQIRKENSPQGKSAGCIFKNSDKVSAGELIEKAGLKNYSVGDAIISEEHSNYFINQNRATEKDFLELMIYAQKKVFEKFGILLKPEIKFANSATEKKFCDVRKKFITVLKGGDCNEREVSLISGKAVAQGLRDSGFTVFEFDIKRLTDIKKLDKEITIFPVLHGGWGENGKLQELLEKENRAFIGCNSETCKIVIDKIKTKELLLENGLLTAKFAVVNSCEVRKPNLKFPLIIKPPEEGSTVGIILVKKESDWENSLKQGFKFSSNLLVEEYIEGVEITVGVINGKVLPPVEIDYPSEIYDYDAKYEHKNGITEYFCPPKNLSQKQIEQSQKIALQFCEIVGSNKIMRIDMIVTKNNDIYIIEGNNLPGFTPDSLLPKAAKTAGISFENLCNQLVVD